MYMYANILHQNSKQKQNNEVIKQMYMYKGGKPLQVYNRVLSLKATVYM